MAPAMSAYHGRGSAVYQPRYPIAYPAAASSVYVYPGGDGAGPAAAPAVVVSLRAIRRPAVPRHPANRSPPPMMAGHHMGYATYSAYDADGGGWALEATAPPSQGGFEYGFGYEHIPQQPYRDGNKHDEDSASAEECD